MTARRPRRAPTPALDALTGVEHSRVLTALLEAHPDLRPKPKGRPAISLAR